MVVGRGGQAVACGAGLLRHGIERVPESKSSAREGQIDGGRCAVQGVLQGVLQARGGIRGSK